MVAPKPIVQVHPTTHAVIRVWQAGSTAARRLGIDLSAISGTARGVRASGAGFRWRYPSGAEARSAVADAEPAAEELAIVAQNRCGRGPKPVAQLHMVTGEAVRVWPTAAAAASFLRCQHGHLGECCRGERASAAGYCWRWATRDEAAAADRRAPPEGKERAKTTWKKKERAATAAGPSGVIPCAKPILQLDARTGAVLRKWPSVASAAKHVGRDSSAISQAAALRASGGSASTASSAGFGWRLSDESGTCYGSKRKAPPADAPRDAEERAAKRAATARRVRQVELATGATVRRWPSVQAASAALGIDRPSIWKVANGRACFDGRCAYVRRSAGGYGWKYFDDDDDDDDDDDGAVVEAEARARAGLGVIPEPVVKAEPEPPASDAHDARARLLACESERERESSSRRDDGRGGR